MQAFVGLSLVQGASLFHANGQPSGIGVLGQPPAPEGRLELLAGLPTWAQVIAILVGALVAAKLIELLGYWLADALDGDEEGSLRTVFFEEITLPLYVSVFMWGVFLSLRLLELPFALGTFRNTVLTLVVVLWARAGLRIGDRSLSQLKRRDRTYEFAPVLKNIWSVGIISMTGVATLTIWEIDVTPLLASAGVLGIVIGFAARDAVANFIGGIALYFDDTYKLGDFIVLESGEKGTVVDIGLRSTTVLTRDRVMVTVPNSALNTSQVINESAPQQHKRIRVPVQVAYGSDVARVESILESVAADVDPVMESPRTEIRFREFGDSGLEYEVRAFVHHPASEPRATHLLNREIYRRFDEEGIEIPYPQRDVRFPEGSSDERPRSSDPPESI
ncbi:MAG: mechanosensitive ion channel family protein [Haloferacaceae archaeon]